jgi:hypothetical protein
MLNLFKESLRKINAALEARSERKTQAAKQAAIDDDWYHIAAYDSWSIHLKALVDYRERWLVIRDQASGDDDDDDDDNNEYISTAIEQAMERTQGFMNKAFDAMHPFTQQEMIARKLAEEY